MKEIVTEEPKMPYTKPMLTKHKPLRNITAAVFVTGSQQ